MQIGKKKKLMTRDLRDAILEIKKRMTVTTRATKD